jgi:glycosyltransferase involved in cell wall biosynthesis
MGKAHFLFLLRDTLPATRPDVAVLFGKELPRYGVTCDLVGQCEPEAELKDPRWPPGAMWIIGVAAKGIKGEAVRTYYDLVGLITKLGAKHGLLQVRDKIRSAVIGLIVARLWRKPFVYWMSFPIAEGHATRASQIGRSNGVVVWLANYLRAWFARFCFYAIVCRFVDHLFVQSDAMMDYMAAHGVPRDRMTAVPMGVDLASFQSVQRSPVPNHMLGRRVIVYLGQLSHDRQSDFLLEVVKHVRESEPNVLLVLAGDAPSSEEQEWIRQRIRDLGVEDHVWLTGWLPQERALPLVSHAEIGLSPIPRGELFDVSSPTKAVEYLALGLPVIANDIPDQKLVIDRSGAGLCVPMTVPAFTTAIVELLADAPATQRMRSAGPKWVAENRSYDRIAQLVAPVYTRLLAARSRSENVTVSS